MDAEGIELLEPSTLRTRTVRTANPFRRERQYPSLAESEDVVSSRLKVVYDGHFDRFFLREDTTAAPLKSFATHSTMRGAAERARMKARPSQNVQWEDLLLPPRSASKRDALSASSTNVRTDVGPAGEVASTNTGSKPSIGVGNPANEVVQLDEKVTLSISAVEKPTENQVAEITPSEVTQPQAVEVTKVTKESSLPPTVQLTAAMTVMTPATDAIASSPKLHRTKFEASVVLLRSLHRFLQKRRRIRLSQLDSTTNASDTHPNAACSLAGRERSPAVISSNSAPAVESASPALSLSLRLDLTSITSPQSGETKPVSPRHSTLQRRARITNYEQHFAKASTPSQLSQAVRVDDADEKEVRWQGNVINVGVELHHEYQSTKSYRHPRHVGHSQPITHVYNLRDLMRIRPTADGFRHVNESCKFTELTSSESESESEDEIATARIPSSDEDDDSHHVFQRGDRVLFYARHRWFKGTILRRIKVSWFYDIRAANGTVFEAIQARRIRVFDGLDERPKVVEYEVGDRVLWRPTLGSEERGLTKHQNYKAVVKAVRHEADTTGKVYDVELRTGRIVKRIRGELLRHQHPRLSSSP